MFLTGGNAESYGGDAARDELGQFGGAVSLIRSDAEGFHDGDDRLNERMSEGDAARLAAEEAFEPGVDGVPRGDFVDDIFQPLLQPRSA